MRKSLPKNTADEELITGEELWEQIRYLDPDVNRNGGNFICIVALLLIASLICAVGLYLHVR